MLGALAALLVVAAPASAGVEPIVVPPLPEAISEPLDLILVPAGCPAPEPADVAFVGTVLAKDEFVEKGTVRYQIDQLRAGSAAPFAVNGVVDVRYGPDSQYLEVDERYLVSAAVDDRIGVLASKVSPEAPLFGGDAVVGLEDTEVECPALDDPIQTINLDGTPVDSGLLMPFFADRTLLLATIGVPAAIVGAVLIGLVLLRRVLDAGFRGIFALGRSAVSPSPDHRAARVRHHLLERAVDHLELGPADDPDGLTDAGETHADDEFVDATS
ncbi:MAG: hypothetical protein ACI8V4_000755 [Ilumatobacter sp.]|jgi:hypothetical protein